MHRVLSIQQMSRRLGQDGETFVTKRLCCSFLFSVGFFTLLGGFLLGRFSIDREILIKKTELENEKLRYGIYLQVIDRFSNNLEILKSVSNQIVSNEKEIILNCTAVLEDKYNFNNSDSIKSAMEIFLMNRIQLVSVCLEKYINTSKS